MFASHIDLSKTHGTTLPLVFMPKKSYWKIQSSGSEADISSLLIMLCCKERADRNRNARKPYLVGLHEN